MFSAYSVANAFIQRAIDGQLHGLNSMKLQKLMYFAQAWHLKGLGRPLFQDTFIREKHGPVLPSIEYQLNAYGSQRVGQLIRTLTQHDDPLVWNEPYLPETAVKARSLSMPLCPPMATSPVSPSPTSPTCRTRLGPRDRRTAGPCSTKTSATTRRFDHGRPFE